MSEDVRAFIAARLDEDPDGGSRFSGLRWFVAEYDRIAASLAAYPNAVNVGSYAMAERALKSIAIVWSDHPDYREEWKP